MLAVSWNAVHASIESEPMDNHRVVKYKMNSYVVAIKKRKIILDVLKYGFAVLNYLLKILRNLKVDVMRKVLKLQGWYVDRTGG